MKHASTNMAPNRDRQEPNQRRTEWNREVLQRREPNSKENESKLTLNAPSTIVNGTNALCRLRGPLFQTRRRLYVNVQWNTVGGDKTGLRPTKKRKKKQKRRRKLPLASVDRATVHVGVTFLDDDPPTGPSSPTASVPLAGRKSDATAPSEETSRPGKRLV